MISPTGARGMCVAVLSRISIGILAAGMISNQCVIFLVDDNSHYSTLYDFPITIQFLNKNTHNQQSSAQKR